MKSRIFKIWGLVLTLAILAGLLVPVAPVSAGTNAWTAVGTPSTLTYQLVAGGSIDFFVAAPDGTTLFAYDNGVGLYKSTNGGATWTKQTALAGLTLTALVVSPNYATDKAVAAATATDVYLSTNGGSSFFNPVTGQTGISSIALSTDVSGNLTMLIGASGGLKTWSLYTGLSSFLITDPVIAVAFSPDYTTDNLRLAITDNASANVKLTVDDGAGWGVIYPDVDLGVATAAKAVIAFAADFDLFGSPNVFVGLAGNDLYRVGIGGTAKDLDLGGVSTTTDVNSVVISGNIGDGKAYVGTAGGTVMKVTGLGGTAVVASPSKNTKGTNAITALGASGKVLAATGGTGSAVYLSTDDASTFNLLSLISISGSLSYQDLKVIDDNTMYLLVEDGADYQIVFKTADAGASWLGVYNETDPAGDIIGIFPSPAYGTDSTVYLAKSNRRALKSSNAGSTWTSRNLAGAGDVSAFAVLDANTYYYGESDGAIYKAGRNAVFANVGAGVTSIVAVATSDIYAATGAGNVYRSTDDGLTFTQVGATLSAGATVVAVDTKYSTNSTIYAATADGDIYIFVVGTSTAWTKILDKSLSITPSVVLTNDGNLYAASGSDIARALNPTAVDQGWDTITGAGAIVSSLQLTNTVVNPTTTNHNIYAVVGGNSIKAFTDTMTNAVAVVAPAAGSSVNKDTTFTWTAYAGATAYDVQVALDAGFINIVYSGSTSGTLLPNSATGNLVPGTTYYWRVRVKAASPLLSNWSPTTSFVVKLTQSGNDLLALLSPGPGATNVPIKPTFQWSPINGATGYDLEVAENPVFVNPIDQQTNLATNVWTLTKTLEYGKVYYWRVRAVNSNTGVKGDWVSQAFTTVSAPVTPPPPSTTTATTTVTVTPPAKFFDANSGLYFTSEADLKAYQAAHPVKPEEPAPTPFYIWVIIAIGAILVIAVIVLIARTRRV